MRGFIEGVSKNFICSPGFLSEPGHFAVAYRENDGASCRSDVALHLSEDPFIRIVTSGSGYDKCASGSSNDIYGPRPAVDGTLSQLLVVMMNDNDCTTQFFRQLYQWAELGPNGICRVELSILSDISR